jgi:hypothetical protein
MTPPENIKSSVYLPFDLWHAVRLRALNERTNARAILIAALRAYLATPPEPRERPRPPVVR